MNKMAKYLSFTYKFRSLMDNVIPEIVDELNNAFTKRPFQVGRASFTDNKYNIQNVFQGYFITYKGSKIYDSSIYIGLNLNLVSEFMDVDGATELQDCILGVDIVRMNSRNGNKGKILSAEEKGNDEWKYYYYNIDLESCLNNQFLDKNLFKQAVVKIIKANHTAFGN